MGKIVLWRCWYHSPLTGSMWDGGRREQSGFFGNALLSSSQCGHRQIAVCPFRVGNGIFGWPRICDRTTASRSEVNLQELLPAPPRAAVPRNMSPRE